MGDPVTLNKVKISRLSAFCSLINAVNYFNIMILPGVT